MYPWSVPHILSFGLYHVFCCLAEIRKAQWMFTLHHCDTKTFTMSPYRGYIVLSIIMLLHIAHPRGHPHYAPVSLCWIYYRTRTNWPFVFGREIVPDHSWSFLIILAMTVTMTINSNSVLLIHVTSAGQHESFEHVQNFCLPSMYNFHSCLCALKTCSYHLCRTGYVLYSSRSYCISGCSNSILCHLYMTVRRCPSPSVLNLLPNEDECKKFEIHVNFC